MHRKFTMALLVTATAAGIPALALAGSLNGYSNNVPQQPAVTTFNAPPVMQTYTMPVEPATPKDGLYDESRYGGNAEFGYEQQSACGGVITGEKCLVILSDHMRRVRLDGPAGTILVGNPLIADVTVLGNDTIFVSARSIGSTNIIVLDKEGNEMVTYEVFVREPRIKRVVLNNGGAVQNYQCAPNCERALTQSDSPAAYNTRSGIISTDLGLDRTAIGLQSGPNPNTQQPDEDVPPPMLSPEASLAGAIQDMSTGLGANGPTAGAAAPQPVRTDAPPLMNGM